MDTTESIIERAKEQRSIDTDYRLSKELGVYPSAVKNYRSGRSHPDDAVAMRLAELANLDKGYVVACIHAERAAGKEAAQVWEKVAAHVLAQLKANGQAAALALAVILSGLLGFDGGPDGGALLSSAANSALYAGLTLYIMSTVRRWARRLAGLFTPSGDQGWALA